jgi:hypothetical protein
MFARKFEKLHKAAAQHVAEAQAAQARLDKKSSQSALYKALALETEAANLAPEEDGLRSTLNLSATVIAYNCGEMNLASELAAKAQHNAPSWVAQNLKVLGMLIRYSTQKPPATASVMR